MFEVCSLRLSELCFPFYRFTEFSFSSLYFWLTEFPYQLHLLLNLFSLLCLNCFVSVSHGSIFYLFLHYILHLIHIFEGDLHPLIHVPGILQTPSSLSICLSDNSLCTYYVCRPGIFNGDFLSFYFSNDILALI